MTKILETPRLILATVSTKDSAFFLTLLNSPNWILFIGDRGVRSQNEAESYIRESLIKSYDSNGYGLYKVTLRENGTPIGICGFVKRDYLEHADIGFATLPEFEGNGYTFEAAKAMMHYGFMELEFSTILAITSTVNTRSRHLLAKIGLLEIGTIKPAGSNKVLLLFSIHK